MSDTKLVNLTPHTLNVWLDDGDDDSENVVLVPDGRVARVAVTREAVKKAGKVTLYHTTYGSVTGLPEPEWGTYLVVSAMVRQAVPDRGDVLSPGELIRDTSGNPIGCRGLDCN